MLTVERACWCGNRQLVPFGPNYAECQNCATLVTRHPPDGAIARVDDDRTAFYGRDYWLAHQSLDLKQPDIVQRMRRDLPERCVYWLRTTLKYLLPPARVLEVGSGPGTFVAMLRWAGFDATGLELSPWVVDYSQRGFEVPVRTGPVENQDIEHHSLEAIVMMDVLEHLPDPVGTMRHCLKLLKPDGVLIIQTPRLPGGKTYQQLVDEADRFQDQLKPAEHLYLFSDRSIRQFFSEMEVHQVVSEPAIFAHYDMFVIACREPLVSHEPVEIEAALQATPHGRQTLALLDLDDQLQESARRLVESEADRSARLRSIETLQTKLLESESDRQARLDTIARLQTLLQESEADRQTRLDAVAKLQTLLQESEVDRAARLDAINDLSVRLAALDEELNATRQELSRLSSAEVHARG